MASISCSASDSSATPLLASASLSLQTENNLKQGARLNPKEVIQFWFEEIDKKNWFTKNEKFDEQVKSRFGSTLEKALQSELFSWRQDPLGRLAEIIVLDQFSRNIHRGKPESFAGDAMALVLAQEAVQWELDQKIEISKRGFLYMPYMHSESKLVHEEALKHFAQPGLEGNYDFEVLHKKIIDRFGRYPHRNQILGRISTEEEIEFLKGPGSSF